MLQVQDLDVFYGRVQALHGVSLNVGEREAVAVLGANGAGKSTLIKAIAGWHRPQRGHVRFNDEDITHLEPWDRAARGLALVPEGGRVFRDLTVEQNLRLGTYLERSNSNLQSRLEEVFDLFPVLAERRHQVARTLSGGEQQMLAIGRAMMMQPRLLLVDEVSMGLMPILVQRVFAVLQTLRERGVTILLVEQNAYEALQVVDRAYVLENGRIVLSGMAEELREDPKVKAAYLGG
ncbi:MAG TPA: ABC transporter ATP-binding protein [Anaerolineae bacterium]|nr:ABC transporter ATP-binding protein [Anaerolineae bacterium]HIQ05636.1 ABC transporter ATP-binding protein [Anaerolineae bacterium]